MPRRMGPRIREDDKIVNPSFQPPSVIPAEAGIHPFILSDVAPSSIEQRIPKAPMKKRRHAAGALSCFKPVSDAQGLTNSSVTLCSAEFHVSEAPRCSVMNRTGNIVCPGAWM